MFIRDDLVNEIKRIFNITEFNYTKAIKTLYDETLLLFNSEGRTITIEFEKEDTYYIYEVDKEFSYRFIVGPMVKLSFNEEETWLKFGSTIVSLPGKAFDFAGELVLLAMEND